MGDEPDLTSINTRLAEIIDELAAIGDADFESKHRLMSERDRLRSQAATFAKDHDRRRTTPDLKAELSAQRSRLDEFEKSLLDARKFDGGGTGTGAYNGPVDAIMINEAMKKAAGIDDLVVRIARIETILSERGEL